MGLTSLHPHAWLEFDENFAADLARKRALLETRHDDAFLALPEAEPAGMELLRLLAIHLPRYHPALFRAEGDVLLNAATGEAWDTAAPTLHPLDVAGRLVMEDLCLIQSAGECHILVGASLCSPARWQLAEKLGKPLAAIHGPVPGYDDVLARPVEHFFAALKPDRLVCRFNWGIADDPVPFQPVAPPVSAGVTAENAGERLWLRVERQTLRRLPLTGAVVFAIRTIITRLDQAITPGQTARDLAAAIGDMPAATQRYKHIAPFAPALLAWLEKIA